MLLPLPHSNVSQVFSVSVLRLRTQNPTNLQNISKENYVICMHFFLCFLLTYFSVINCIKGWLFLNSEMGQKPSLTIPLPSTSHIKALYTAGYSILTPWSHSSFSTITEDWLLWVTGVHNRNLLIFHLGEGPVG